MPNPPFDRTNRYMKSRYHYLIPFMLLTTSCNTQRYGVYKLEHRHSLSNGYEAVVFRSNGDARFEVWKGKFPDGHPVCQMEFDADGHVDAWIPPYKSVEQGTLPDGVKVRCDGKKIIVTRFITKGSNTIFLIDRGNDGFPEERCTITPTERIYESIRPFFTSEKKRQVEKPVGGDGKPVPQP